ncbi:uncharacterized protein BDZ99DRAFT_515919 [Mytilinidion resinicola]|uniref:F-box domain-containing protein n=1 Tax=Mytilinidion resinicola TaxID=574789 RepID=A0A6A6Z3C3_9PEZI|nr:uncharacterized protein BDZ99DRAFT_515919 [Mytilinidion resinicola]KAF2815173.1 hypothetical protein BDZ99DRAFT_515919 [Mytilinidion resinicola]
MILSYHGHRFKELNFLIHSRHTTSIIEKMEASAAKRVLGVTELLEFILLKLPIQNIFQAQRVCKQWKEAIDNSSPLQQAMWLTPRHPSSPPAIYEEEEVTYAGWNGRVYDPPQVVKVITAKHLNPFLKPRSSEVEDPPGFRRNQIRNPRAQDTSTIELRAIRPFEFTMPMIGLATPGADTDHRATWQDMQVASPPCTKIEVHYISSFPFNVRDETGVRMGRLVKEIAMLQSHRETWFPSA